MSKSINDPLESAKVSANAPAKKPKKAPKKPEPKKEAQTPAPEPAQKTLGMDPLDSDTAVHPPEASPKPEPEEAPALVRKVARFKVLADCTFSRNGHVTKMAAGHTISSQHYGGMPGIQKMIASGMQLEELKG